MNDFNQRWQRLATEARGAPDAPAGELPFGFVTRVLALGRQAPAEGWEDLLGALGLRAVLVTACLALISAGLAYNEFYPSPGIECPAPERALTNDLPWP